MKKFKVKNYKGNLLESVKKFQEAHKDMRIVEAYEDAGVLGIGAEPLPPPPSDTVVPEEPLTSAPEEEPAAKLGPADKVADFGSKLLSFGVEVHLWHLNCARNDEHLALKELYEACDDVGDRLLEAAIGQTNVPAAFATVEGMDPTYTETSIEKIVAIKNEANELTRLIDLDAGFENILGDFCETCNSVIYKLKRLA